jgi:hypothetical protein
MWGMLKYLIMRIALLRWILGSLGSLGVLVPILLLLKAIGLPVLIVLGLVAIPILLALLFVGLPIFLVLICGAILLGIAWAVLTVGAVVIKPLLIIVLPTMLMGYLAWWLIWGRKRGGGERPA